MNMDMEDIYYNKYIKYKTKYLELKEQSGTGFMDNFKALIGYNNKDIYGSKYYYLENCLIKTKVIEKIIKTKDVDYIKNKIMTPPDYQDQLRTDCNEHCKEYYKMKNYNKQLKNFVEGDIIKIIKNSNISVIDTISVLNDIEKVLFDHILPGLYLKFEGKLHEEDLEKKLDAEQTEKKWTYEIHQKTNQKKANELQKELEAQIKVKNKVQDKNNKDNKNIVNIIEVYNIFCNINKLYYNYYKNETNDKLKEELTKSLKEIELKLKSLLIEIQPKVKLLIEVVELYFFFLYYYINNNIKPHTTYKRPFEGNVCTDDKQEFIQNRGLEKIDNEKKIFHYKVYEKIFYGDDGKTLEDLNSFYNDINKINNASSQEDLINMKNILRSILRKIDSNNINIDIDINKNKTTFYNYYLKYKYFFENDYYPFLLKKSINIFLYKIFNYINTP